MLDLFNIPIPQTANYQEFYNADVTSAVSARDWVKPRGASMVRIMLIGGGGGGGNGTSSSGGGGGGSGAVTSWIGPAMFVPDVLNISVGAGGVNDNSGNQSQVYYKVGNFYLLLSANGGSRGAILGGAGGAAMTGNQFTACGIYNSVAGQSGAAGQASSSGGNVAVSATTFLSGGAGGSGAAASTGGRVTPNYGYIRLENTPAGGTVKGADGYFINQPILVGCGGAGGTTSTSVGTGGGNGGIGCGGGGSGEDGGSGGRGGDGAIFIWAW